MKLQRNGFITRIALVALCASAAVMACEKPPTDGGGGGGGGGGNGGGGGGGGGGGTSGSAVLVGAGTIGMCNRPGDGRWDDLTASLLDQVIMETPDAKIFAIEPMAEDTAYTSATYADCYGPSWGRHKDRTFVAAGKGDADLSVRWGAYFDYFGDRAGTRDQGYYSFDLAAWHVIVLNSNAGVEAGSPQHQWLMADLQANASKKCTMAIWDRAHFYGAKGSPLMPHGVMANFWNTLYAAGADLIVNGSHRSWQYYERYAPMNTRGEKDEARGMREFIVGTGGRYWNSTLPDAHPSVEARDLQARGVLKLTLDPDKYSWKFIAAPPSTFTDEGTTACH
jgi:hypothetical protein